MTRIQTRNDKRRLGNLGDFTQADSALCWTQARHSMNGKCACALHSVPTQLIPTPLKPPSPPFLVSNENSCASQPFSFYSSNPPMPKTAKYLQIMHLESSPNFGYWGDLGFEYIVSWKYFGLPEVVRRKRKLPRKKDYWWWNLWFIQRKYCYKFVNSIFAWQTQPLCFYKQSYKW